MDGTALRTAAIAGLVAASTFSSPGPGATAQETPPAGMIAYAANVGGDYEIFVMHADGSNARQLTFNDLDDFEPQWSPTGRRLVFERERNSGGYEDLYIVGVRSGVERPWVRSPGIDEGDAAWSPDGDWIAFRGSDWGDGADVVALRVDRSKGRYVAAQSENSTNSDPAWSPDGKRVAHVESYEGAGIYLASFCCSHGYKKKELTYSGSWKHDLDWSPDASCIVYTQSESIRTIPVAGGEPRLVHKAPSAGGSEWTPDGSRILFDATTAGSSDLYTVSPDGTELTRLTETPDVEEITPSWWAPPVTEPHTPECGTPPASPTPAPAYPN